jgi:hypothetical protein
MKPGPRTREKNRETEPRDWRTKKKRRSANRKEQENRGKRTTQGDEENINRGNQRGRRKQRGSEPAEGSITKRNKKTEE